MKLVLFGCVLLVLAQSLAALPYPAAAVQNSDHGLTAAANVRDGSPLAHQVGDEERVRRAALKEVSAPGSGSVVLSRGARAAPSSPKPSSPKPSPGPSPRPSPGPYRSTTPRSGGTSATYSTFSLLAVLTLTFFRVAN